jgi:tetratricopeptide (TPR) repeat protein
VELRLTVHARPHRQVAAVLAIVAMIAGTAVAAPKKADAKAAFDRGVKAYQAGDYEAASAALGESYELEADAETLFAWAQSERKLDRCDKAIELWTKLQKFDLPKENRAAIDQKIDECKRLLAEQPPPEPTPDPVPVDPVPVETRPIEDPPPPERDGPRSRWKDPIGLAMIGLGVAGLATGTVFTLQARSADQDKDSAPTYDEFVRLRDRAESKGKLGLIGLGVGGALVAGGIVWIMTRPSGGERPPVSAWFVEGGGGVVVTGGF